MYKISNIILALMMIGSCGGSKAEILADANNNTGVLDAGEADAREQTPLNFQPDMMEMTFEGTEVGVTASGGTGWPRTHPLEGVGGFSDGRNRWEFSDERVFSGTRSMKINMMKRVDSGTNKVGGSIANSVPTTIGEGGEFWWRMMVFLPDDFDPGTFGSSPAKWFRIYRRHPDGEQRGALEFKLNSNGGYRFANEFGSENKYITPQAQDAWTPGWNAFEVYAKFSTTNGIVRFWRNNKLVYELDVVTLPEGADHMWRTQFIAYWNCTKRGDCYDEKTGEGMTSDENDLIPYSEEPIYVDDMFATTSANPPVNVDDAGNLFIGGVTP